MSIEQAFSSVTDILRSSRRYFAEYDGFANGRLEQKHLRVAGDLGAKDSGYWLYEIGIDLEDDGRLHGKVLEHHGSRSEEANFWFSDSEKGDDGSLAAFLDHVRTVADKHSLVPPDERSSPMQHQITNTIRGVLTTAGLHLAESPLPGHDMTAPKRIFLAAHSERTGEYFAAGFWQFEASVEKQKDGKLRCQVVEYDDHGKPTIESTFYIAPNSRDVQNVFMARVQATAAKFAEPAPSMPTP
jgi:hypothetical protein